MSDKHAENAHSLILKHAIEDYGTNIITNQVPGSKLPPIVKKTLAKLAEHYAVSRFIEPHTNRALLNVKLANPETSARCHNNHSHPLTENANHIIRMMLEEIFDLVEFENVRQIEVIERYYSREIVRTMVLNRLNHFIHTTPYVQNPYCDLPPTEL